jgi:hypothetical protein
MKSGDASRRIVWLAVLVSIGVVLAIACASTMLATRRWRATRRGATTLDPCAVGTLAKAISSSRRGGRAGDDRHVLGRVGFDAVSAGPSAALGRRIATAMLPALLGRAATTLMMLARQRARITAHARCGNWDPSRHG